MISIFNDVVGPVMRGPSSSHCAAALRIGRIARDLMDGDLRDVRLVMDRKGSLATTHETQGSDIGFCGGLLGWNATDERLPRSPAILRDTGVRVHCSIEDLGDRHPNTYNLIVGGERERHTMQALSTGGGIIEVTRIDDFSLSLRGDSFATLVFLDGEGVDPAEPRGLELAGIDEVVMHRQHAGALLEVRGQRFLEDKEVGLLCGEAAPTSVKRLAPVLPVLSRKEMSVPFTSAAEMIAFDAGRNLPLWKLAVAYERERGNLSHVEVITRMKSIVQTVRRSIDEGIAGTVYDDRILGYQCGEFRARMEEGRLLDGGLLNRIVLAVTALMETKSSMGVIVAAPTAGSCGAFPGACLAASEGLSLTDEDAAKAMLAGALVGVFIAARSTFAAEVAGCQAECGAGSGMAAAGLISLAGGTTGQALTAASLALQNTLGLPCDPVANRVEVPCLGKNVMAAANALACANMALAGYDPVIPLDEVIETMDRVGPSLPRELRCTALGGLSITSTSREIEKRLEGGVREG